MNLKQLIEFIGRERIHAWAGRLFWVFSILTALLIGFAFGAYL